jgi:hypothetical protein
MALRASMLILACLAMSPVRAAESDVHFGLTKFLAIQAGFDVREADAIALGNQRVESGDMQYVALVLDYACLERDAELAKEVSLRSFPSSAQAPAPAEKRAVAAGGELALKEVREQDEVKSTQGGFLLFKLGQALHLLQASYSHQGTPDTPQMAPYFTCDPAMSWAHPRARGGWNSHAADLTLRWPAETVAMAKATFDALVRYPILKNVQRKPKDWNAVRPLLDGFIKASTKAEKQAWFEAQGITDVAFLAGTSLRDGPKPFELEWGGRRLPKLQAMRSRQHETDPALLDFYSRFFDQWLSTDDFDALAAAHGAHAPKSADRTELAARLRLWRIRDHGAVADFAHSQARLTGKQLGALAILAKTPAALARYARTTDAVFPLVTNGKNASPLLPFIVRSAPASSDGRARAVAVAKLLHAPYDTLGVVAENVAGNWKVIAIVSAVDH